MSAQSGCSIDADLTWHLTLSWLAHHVDALEVIRDHESGWTECLNQDGVRGWVPGDFMAPGATAILFLSLSVF